MAGKSTLYKCRGHFILSYGLPNNGKGRGIATPLFGDSDHLFPLTPFLYHPAKVRYKNVTICARVQEADGENVVALVPLVIPFATAQRTAGE